MSEHILVLCLCLGGFPLLYLGLCVWMCRSVPNPPCVPFFFIFGSVAGYFLLCALLMPSPVGLLVVLPYMLICWLVLIGVFIATLMARPRSGFHIAASVSSGLLSIPPLLLIVFGSLFRS